MSKNGVTQAFSALPPYFGGKRKLLPWIFQELANVIPSTEWQNKVFLDAFAGGGSVSLYARLQGFKKVLANDWSARTQIIFQGLLQNDREQLSKDDLLILRQPLPIDIPAWISQQFVPHVFSTRHGEALDRVAYWAHQYESPVKRNMALLLLWHMVSDYVCMPTSIGTSNRPYAETLDGLRDWQDLNPKRFLDESFPRLLKPRWSSLESLRCRINVGVTGGAPVHGFQMDACAFVESQQSDIAYFDPPYPGTLSYEQSLKTLDQVLLGPDWQPVNATSPFTKDVNSLKPLLESARHIPVWLLSYGNNCIDLAGLIALVKELAPARTVRGLDRSCQHLSHVSKSQNRKELLVIAY